MSFPKATAVPRISRNPKRSACPRKEKASTAEIKNKKPLMFFQDPWQRFAENTFLRRTREERGRRNRRRIEEMPENGRSTGEVGQGPHRPGSRNQTPKNKTKQWDSPESYNQARKVGKTTESVGEPSIGPKKGPGASAPWPQPSRLRVESMEPRAFCAHLPQIWKSVCVSQPQFVHQS